MRAITPAERALIGAGRLAVHARCLVTDGDGAWRDVSALVVSGGLVNLFDGATIDVSLDQPVSTATVTLRRDTQVVRTVGASIVRTAVSIAPTMTASSLNRRADGAYAPLVDVGRGIRVAIAVTTPNALPTAGDWRGLFEGVIDGVDWANSSGAVPVTCRDLGARLLDAQIETEHDYGGPVTIGGTSHAGTPLAVVMRALLDDNGFSSVPLIVDGDPAWELGRYTQTFGNVLTALRDLAAQIGWDVRYRWRGASGSYGTFALVLGEPDRAKTTPDLTLPPSEYRSVDALSVNIADVRNVVRVTYTDRATGLRATLLNDPAVVGSSVTRYGRRYMELAQDASSAIDTATEAQRLADAAASDLAFPAADQSVTAVGCWPVDLGDLVQFPPNDVHYDETQALAVQSVRWSLTPGHLDVSLRTRGTVAGLYKTWLAKAGTPGTQTVDASVVVNARDDLATATTVSFDVTAKATAGAVSIERRTGASLAALKAAAWTSIAGPAASPLASTNAVTRPTDVAGYAEYRAVPATGDPSLPEQRKFLGQSSGGGGGGGGGTGTAPTLTSQSITVDDRGSACTPESARGVIGWGITFDAAMPSGWAYAVHAAGYEFGLFTGDVAFGTIDGAKSGGYGTDAPMMDLVLSWTMYDNTGAVVTTGGYTNTVPAWSGACLIADL